MEYLFDYVLYDFIEGKSDEGVDTEHVPQLVLKHAALDVPVEQRFNEVEERRKVLIRLQVSYTKKETCNTHGPYIKLTDIIYARPLYHT